MTCVRISSFHDTRGYHLSGFSRLPPPIRVSARTAGHRFIPHHDSLLPVPGAVFVPQLCCRGASSCPSHEEAFPPLSRKLCERRGPWAWPPRPILDIETPELCHHPGHQSGPSSLRLANSPLPLTAACRNTTSLICVLFASGHRAFKPRRAHSRRSQLKTLNSPQSFNVIIDTGISDLWVMTSACTSCNPDATGFNNASSTTFKAAKDSTGQPTRISITYGAGPVVGDLVQDTVAMGAFQVQSQPWVLADQVPATVLDGSGSGAMGLAFDSIAYTGATPFWQSLAQGGMLATPEMSFWLTRLLGDQSAQNEDFGGVFTLGGRNQTLYTGDVDFLPLVTNAGRKTSWLINVSGTYLIYRCLALCLSHTVSSTTEVTVNKKNISLSSGSVGYIVTGTTLIGAPTAAVSAIYAQIPDSQVLSGNFSGYYGIRMFGFLLTNQASP